MQAPIHEKNSRRRQGTQPGPDPPLVINDVLSDIVPTNTDQAIDPLSFPKPESMLNKDQARVPDREEGAESPDATPKQEVDSKEEDPELLDAPEFDLSQFLIF